MAGVRLLLTRWHADAGLLAVIVVVVALTAGLVGAVPRLLDRLALASLDGAVDAVTVDRAGLAATTVRPFGAASPGVVTDSLDGAANVLDEQLAPELQQALGPPTTLLDTVRYDLAPLPGEPPDGLQRKLTIRVQPGASPYVEDVVAGEAPDGAIGEVELDVGATGPDGAPIISTLKVHQFLATAATAEALDLEVGERRIATPDATGPILQRSAAARVPAVVVELAGIVELSPLEDPLWFGDPRLHRASQFDTNAGTTVFATGLVPREAVLEAPGIRDRQPASISVRWQLDRAGLLASDTAAVQQAAVALRTTPALTLEQPSWSTGLDRLLATEAARRATAVEVLGLAAVAVVGVAGALLLAIVAVLALRRRDQLALVRGRGASQLQLLGAAIVEFGLVTAAALAVALVVLQVVLPGGAAVWLPAAVAGLALVVLVTGALHDARRRLGALLSQRRRLQPVQRVRHVLDGLLVLVAIVAVTALRRRGVDLDAGTDPLVIAAPVLVAAAAAVVTARLAPLPLRTLEAVARRARGMALPVGLARAARAAGSGTVVVLLVLGLGVAGLAGAVHRSLVTGQARAAQEQVGADVRIDAPPLSSLSSDWEAPGAGDRVAALRELPRLPLVADLGAQRVDVVLVDPADVAAMPGNEGLPDLTWDGVGPAPVLVSNELQPLGSPAVGETVTVALDQQARVAVVIADFVPRALGRDAEDGTYVVIDRSAAEAASGVVSGVTSRLVATDDPAAVAAAAAQTDPGAEVLVRVEVEQALRDAPLAAGVRVGFLVAAAAAILATAAALVLALVATAPQRRRQAAVLGAVGASPGRVRAALLAEVLPVVAGAATVGIGLAAAVAVLLGERLDLSPFAGTADRADLVLPHWSVAVGLVAGALVTAAVAAIVTQGRVDPGALLREGDA